MSTIIGKFVPVGEPDGRKEFHVTTMKERGDGWVGLKEDETKCYHVYNSHWKFEPTWNGEGLPPVGTECEYSGNGEWSSCVIVAQTKEYTVIHVSSGEVVLWTREVNFRPLRTEADRKREEFANSLIKHLDGLNERDNPVGYVHALAIYDAIKSGEIEV